MTSKVSERPLSELPRDPNFAALRQYILSLTGLEYYGNREQDLAQRIQRRLTARNMTRIADYLALIRAPDSDPEARAERDAIIDAVTIGETYFFRFPEQFDAMKAQVLPEVLKRNQDRKTLNIWCAGCSNGSEPYTISILLRREFGDLLRDWQVQILGTDINARALNQAKSGWYHSWALRTLDTEQRRALFEFDTSTSRYLIKTPFKRNTRFLSQNLFQDTPPLPESGQWDLIFCRNVLIYFDVPTIEQTITRFAENLVPGGYLFLGHAEPGPVSNMGRLFETVRVPGAILYRRRGAEEDFAPTPFSLSEFGQHYLPASVEPVENAVPWSPPILSETTAPVARTQPAEAPVPEDISVEALHREIRRLLDADRIAEVLTRLEPLLSSEKKYPLLRHDPVLHYYQSLALERAERWSEAEAAVRRALYLDRSFLLAHYQHATLTERRGDLSGAIRALDTVQIIIENSKENTRPLAQLAEIGDLTIGEMREIVVLKRATLQRRLAS